MKQKEVREKKKTQVLTEMTTEDWEKIVKSGGITY